MRALLLFGLILLPAFASAQTVDPPAADEADGAEAPAADAKRSANAEEAKADGDPEWTLELAGRVFVRDTFTQVDVGDAVWRHERQLDQARFSVDYERKRLRISIEVDFAGDDVNVKDTFIRVRPVDALRIQAGRFKVPMSFLGRESKWRIPSVERGLIGELELDDRDLPFAGARAEGLSVELRPQVALAPRFTVGVFQSPLATGMSPLDPSEDVTQDAYARLEVEPVTDLHLAASFALVGYQEQLGQAATYHHQALGSLEVYADTRHVRAWLEGFAGQSFFHQADGSSSGRFVAGRALVSPRIRRLAGLYRLEPYAGASLFDPTDDLDDDRVTEGVVGVNAAFSRYWRLQIEGAQRYAQGTTSPVADSSIIRIQLGASFAERVH